MNIKKKLATLLNTLPLSSSCYEQAYSLLNKLASQCPSCGHAKAYVGFADVECPNNKCKHYKKNEEKNLA